MSKPEQPGNVEKIEDPEEYVATRRLKDIFDAREGVREDRRRAKGLMYEENSEMVGRSVYRTGVETYISEVQPLLRRTDEGTRLWSETPFGSITFEPETRVQSQRVDVEVFDGTEWHRTRDPPEPTRIHLEGLQSLFELGDPITYTAEFDAVVGLSKRQTKQLRYREQPDWQVLDEMVLSVNDYLSKIGVELDISDGDDEANFDYSDIV